MEKSRFLLFSAGMIAISALLTAANVFAQSSCTSETTTHSAGNIIVNVAQTTLNGQRTYKYTMTNAPGKSGNPNKFFVYVKDGLESDLSSTVCAGTSCSPAAYLDHNETTGGFPPAEVWRANKHEDGVGATSVAIGKEITLNVPERFQPEEAVTTVLLGIGTTYEHCGPIYGPTTPAALGFDGSPLVSTVSRKLFENGCAYFVTAGETDNIVQTMTPDPATPYETVYIGTPKPCTVTNSPDIAVTDLGLVFLPPGELGRPPLQSVLGGTCYYPPNLKFTC